MFQLIFIPTLIRVPNPDGLAAFERFPDDSFPRLDEIERLGADTLGVPPQQIPLVIVHVNLAIVAAEEIRGERARNFQDLLDALRGRREHGARRLQRRVGTFSKSLNGAVNNLKKL